VTVLLDSTAVLAEGVAALRRLDPVMDRIVAGGAEPPLRKREPGLASLVSIIVSQQLSTSSAAAIWKRLQAALPALSAHDLATATDETLRGAGLSAPKIRTLRAIGEALEAGTLPLDRLHELGADEAHTLMTAVRGIGPWTADIYLLFCLGHPDAFPAGDLALQEAARIAYDLQGRPSPAALADLAERWRPWRGVAAKALWAFYAQVKSREGAPTA
jgi:DNA-3-methyladenine glycosylase II